MTKLTSGRGGGEKQSGLQGKSFAANKGGYDHRKGSHMPKGPGPVGGSHPKTGSQRGHFKSAGGSGSAHCFPGRRK